MEAAIKIISFLRAQSAGQRQALQGWFLEAAQQAMATSNPRGLTVNAVIDRPPDYPRRAYEGQGERDHDAVVELVADDMAGHQAFWSALEKKGLKERIDQHHRYRVNEIEVKNTLPRAVGKTPGIKYIGRVQFHDDLTDVAIRRSWKLHGELALRIFTDMHKYVQVYVEDQLDRDAVPTQGLPLIWFPSFAGSLALVPGGKEQELHDLKHFLKSGVRLYAEEHVLRVA